MVPVVVWNYHYSDVVWIFFSCQSCPVNCMLGCIFVMWVGVSYALSLILEGVTERSKDFVLCKGGVEF